MKKEQVLAKMKEDCLVAVVRAKDLEQGEKVVDAIIAGGINFIEITMTMDEGNPVEFIAKMAENIEITKTLLSAQVLYSIRRQQEPLFWQVPTTL